MMEISLTRGLSTLIDDSDREAVNKFKWCAQKCNGKFYAARRSGNKILLLHRELTNATKGQRVDHENGDSLDNRRDNLRHCTQRQNLQGFQKKRSGSTSKFRGVCLPRKSKKWLAQIEVEGKNLRLGSFDSEVEAALAYNEAAKTHFKEFAQLNKVP